MIDPPDGPSPSVAKSQVSMNLFVKKKHTLRNDMHRLVCESNFSLRQIVSSTAQRRILMRAYPGDPPPPKSIATLRKQLMEEAEIIRNKLRVDLSRIREKGDNAPFEPSPSFTQLFSWRFFYLIPFLPLPHSVSSLTGHKVSISFDEATVTGANRYITLNLYSHVAFFGASKIAPLGLIRVYKRATAEYLRRVINRRLRVFALKTENILVAATDGASNVLKAVQLMGVKKQKCMAHGLDLVVKRALFGRKGKKAPAFDITILSQESDVADDDDESESEDSEIEDDYENSESDDEDYDNTGPNSDSEREETPGSEWENVGDATVTLNVGGVLQRLRDVVRVFRRRASLMDELREVTARKEYNGKRLCVKLDCKTRWYSTFLMVERTLRILPAMNNVLSRHSTPISANDNKALREISAVLAPFKRAILVLCESKTTLLHADKVLQLLIRDLEEIGTEMAEFLLTELKTEIKKRRTILSTVLAVLDDPHYQFDLENSVGVSLPSDGEMIAVLAEIVNADESHFPSQHRSQSPARVSPCCALFAEF